MTNWTRYIENAENEIGEEKNELGQSIRSRMAIPPTNQDINFRVAIENSLKNS